MAAAYSMDLRERVVEAVEVEGLSCNQAAARFNVAVSTVIDWVNRYRRTGSVAPDQIGGYRPKKLIGQYRAGCCSAAGKASSPCVDWSASWLNGA